MNAMLSITNPLPAILDQPASAGPGRRHLIENYCLSPCDVARFNLLLLRLGRRQAPLDRDQVVTAARELCDSNSLAVEPSSIRERVQQIETAALMVDDPDWEGAGDAIDTARLVIDYTRGGDHLIPDWVPAVGRLDDAIVVETAWPRLAAEIGRYLDFRRLRNIIGDDPGSTLRFMRADWERARREEAALVAHQRDVREHSYLPPSASLFRVH